MKVEKRFTCALCGGSETFTLDEEEFDHWQAGALIQNCFPELSADQRELMISQTCGKCFDEMITESDDPEYR